MIVVGAAAPAKPGLEAPLDALRRLVAAGAKPRPAAAVVAELTGVGANALYRALTAERSAAAATDAGDAATEDRAAGEP